MKNLKYILSVSFGAQFDINLYWLHETIKILCYWLQLFWDIANSNFSRKIVNCIYFVALLYIFKGMIR